jgi:hypothetical protein
MVILLAAAALGALIGGAVRLGRYIREENERLYDESSRDGDHTDSSGWEHKTTGTMGMLIDSDSSEGDHFSFNPKSNRLHATFDRGKTHVDVDSGLGGLTEWNTLTGLYGGLERKAVLYGLQTEKPKKSVLSAYNPFPIIDMPKEEEPEWKKAIKSIESMRIPMYVAPEPLPSSKRKAEEIDWEKIAASLRGIVPETPLFHTQYDPMKKIDFKKITASLRSEAPETPSFTASSFSYKANQDHWLGRDVPEKTAWSVDSSPAAWKSPVLSKVGDYDSYMAPVRAGDNLIGDILERNARALDSQPRFDENEFMRSRMIPVHRLP